jgi:hypothetical protein
VRKSSLPVDTTFSRYAVGLRHRILLNPASSTPFLFATSLSYCGWDFDFGPTLPRGTDIAAPTAMYRMLRLGVDASLQLRSVTFYGALAYLHGLSIAAPSSRTLDDLRFPHLPTARGMGTEMRAGVGLAIWRSVELRLAAEYAVMVFHLQSVEGRADEPALVLDAYMSVGLGPYVSF